MERLQELIQRTETIQKVNALQQNVAKQLFTYPILGKKEKTKRRIRKYLLFQQIPHPLIAPGQILLFQESQ